MFNFISATTREDAVVGQHFADVFNLDESVTTMIKSPRVLAGFAWFGLKKMFGRTKLPMGTDNQLDPPSDIWRDWKPTPGGRALVIPKGTPVQDIPSVSSAEPIAAVSASASNQAKAG